MQNQPNKSSYYSFCLSSFLYNNFQNSKERTLIIDTRDAQSYSKRHIAGSINLNNQRIEEALKKKPNTIDQPRLTLSDLTEMLRNDESIKFSTRRRCFCFLIISENSLSKTLMQDIRRLADHDELADSFQITENNIKATLERTLEGSEERDSILNALEIFKILQKDRVRELFILLDGGLSFFARYPYMSNSIDLSPKVNLIQTSLLRSLECDFPHDILEGRLFLGSFNQSQKHSLVSSLKITHILNMTFECENVHEDKGIKYLKISILDEADKNIAVHFEEAYQFIHEALHENKENNILVHCAMGKSRSATMIIMYLMKIFNWSFEKAFTFVKRKRDVVCLNEGFIQQLQNFESQNLSFMGRI